MHGNAWTCYMQKINSIMGKNPIQTTKLTRYKQSHNPRMHEHVKKMLENAMHEHVRTTQQNPTQKF